jgi:hypothetical protein
MNTLYYYCYVSALVLLGFQAAASCENVLAFVNLDLDLAQLGHDLFRALIEYLLA